MFRVAVISGSGSRTLDCLKVIYWCGKKVWAILKVPGEELDWISKSTEKVFAQIKHGRLVHEIINLEFLPEFHQLKEKIFGFIGHSSSQVWNDFSDVVDGIFECHSWFNWCVNRHRGGIVAGEIKNIINSGRWV